MYEKNIDGDSTENPEKREVAEMLEMRGEHGWRGAGRRGTGSAEGGTHIDGWYICKYIGW